MAASVLKRLIVCCDGTWQDANKGYNRGTLFHPQPTLQAPSNIARLSRSFKQLSSLGRVQVVMYLSGIDTMLGGAFGIGLAEQVREVYSFLCQNYSDGDEIILIGFSRGAYTARSVSGMVGDLGLLTRAGQAVFYPIFKDLHNMMNSTYHDDFPDTPFANKPRGQGGADQYRAKLEEMGLSRSKQGNGDWINIKAVAVYDTVGSLGIPQFTWLKWLKLGRPSREYQFYDTSLSNRIETAFQALALDENRSAFAPAVWERTNESSIDATRLRQVWFPGNHGNVGGGWDDQKTADLPLAWMMDQLSSVGCEFADDTIERVFAGSWASAPSVPKGKKASRWASSPIYEDNEPFRPWGLGMIQQTTEWLLFLPGRSLRTPGLYKVLAPETGRDTGVFLRDTNERVHSSVRVRLACGGLGFNDRDVWKAPALTQHWRLVRSAGPATTSPSAPAAVSDPEIMEDNRWEWQYSGPASKAPTRPDAHTLLEEPLGPYERQLLELAGGKRNVYTWAGEQK